MSRDYAAAEKMARELIAKNPNVAELYFILGDCLMSQQQPEQALQPLQTALRLRRDYPAAHAVLGRALIQTGRGGEAIPHLEAALPVDADGSLHFQLSRAYQDAGQSDRAAAMLKAYKEIQKSISAEEIQISGPRQ